MRLKTIVAASMGKAMKAVRAELGDDAIIISSLTQDDGQVRVTAALEREDFMEDGFFEPEEPDPPPRPDSLLAIEQALRFHGVPLELADGLLNLAAEIRIEDPALQLASALKDRYRFKSARSLRADTPIMLVGPPGAGKTVSTAKIAAESTLAGASVAVASIDTTRAAANEQLGAFTNIMGIELKTATTPGGLAHIVAGTKPGHAIIIDSDGVNPFEPEHMSRLAEYLEASGAEPILVLSAGMDPLEAADMAAVFNTLKTARVMTTRIDMARRVGGMLTSADAGGLALADIGIASNIANGLAGLDPISLARILLRDPLRLDLPLPLPLPNAEAAE